MTLFIFLVIFMLKKLNSAQTRKSQQPATDNLSTGKSAYEGHNEKKNFSTLDSYDALPLASTTKLPFNGAYLLNSSLSSVYEQTLATTRTSMPFHSRK